MRKVITVLIQKNYRNVDQIDTQLDLISAVRSKLNAYESLEVLLVGVITFDLAIFALDD